MIDIAVLLIKAATILLIFAISSLPLYFAVKTFRKKIRFTQVVLAVIISGIIVSVVQSFFNIWGGLISFILVIWLYREMFKLKWHKALLAWLLQFVFIAIFYVIFALLFAVPLGIAFLL